MPQPKDKDWLNGFKNKTPIYSVQFSSVAQSCPTLCNPMNHSTPGLPVHHHLPEFTQTHVKTRDTYRLKVRGWKKLFHANRDQKKSGVAILISDKIDFKTKAVKRDKEGHYIMIKGSIREEDITIMNIYAPNIGACNM